MNEFKNIYGLEGDQLSFLSYDLLGLVYFLIYENDFNITKKIFYKKSKFKGKIGIFEINKNIITHQLNFYSVEDNKFKKIFNFFKSSYDGLIYISFFDPSRQK